MSDFGEKANDEGFSDDVEFFDYLCDEAAKEMKHEYQAGLIEEANAEAAFLVSKKSALTLRNFDKIANSIGFTVLHNFGLKLHAADIEDSEVTRNLEFCKVNQGDILNIIFSSKDSIIRFNNLFNIEFSFDDVFDDVYFIKHTNHHNMEIWVGSPLKDSDEKSFIMKMMNCGYVIKALITHVIDDFHYTYCLIQSNVSPPFNVAEVEEF